MAGDLHVSTLVDAAIALASLEVIPLLLWRHRLPPRDVLINLGSGLALMLALRSRVRDDRPAALLGWLGVAGLAHAADLVLRWRRPLSAERATS